MNCDDISVMHEERERKGGTRVLVFCGVERETQGCSLSVTGRRCAEEGGPCAERKAGQRAAGRFAGQNGR